jgi:hypothetical protein
MRNKRRGNRHGFVTPTVAGVSFVSKMADEDIVRSPPDRPWCGRILGDWHRRQKTAGVGVATPALPVQAIVPDKDTWIDGDFGFQLDRAN